MSNDSSLPMSNKSTVVSSLFERIDYSGAVRNVKAKRRMEQRKQSPKRSTRHKSHIHNPVSVNESIRTIFVSNLPNDIHHKKVKQLFSTFGKVESTRIRCIHLTPPPPPSSSHEKRIKGRSIRVLSGQRAAGEQYSSVAYVVFQEEKSAVASIELTGSVQFGRHISVSAEKDVTFPTQKSLFLGDLSPDVSDEAIWEACLPKLKLGSMLRLRVIRDPSTGQSRGIAYVEFSNTTGVKELLTSCGELLVGNRPARISRVQTNSKVRTAALGSVSRRERRWRERTLDRTNSSKRSGKGTNRTSGKRREMRMNTLVKDESVQPWMGMTTDPRKKLSYDLRELTGKNSRKKTN